MVCTFSGKMCDKGEEKKQEAKAKENEKTYKDR